MAGRQMPLLHRDDPKRAPLVGHVKVTRDDWLNVARAALIDDGVSGVKIMALAERLQVSRSSFYWYFGSRQDLLEALRADWVVRNTAPIVEHCRAGAPSISAACCNFFRCFIDPGLFDRHLDFAIRGWARIDPDMRAQIRAEDAARLEAVAGMFLRYGYAPDEAEVRARILYYMQLGYHALEVEEPMSERMRRIEAYLEGFTGQSADPEAVQSFKAFAERVAGEM